MEAIRKGSHSAYRALLERYWGRLVAYAVPMLGGRDAAEDVVQEVFIRLWRSRSGWQSRGSVGAYLYRITRNLALNRRRDRKVALDFRLGPDVGLSGPRPPRDPDTVLHVEILRRDVERAIAALPERRREVFILARFHRLSYREIADAMGISPQTVANQMSQALASLRELLERHRPRG